MDLLKFYIAPIFFIIATQFSSEVNSANILFYHHIATYSHRVVTYPLADALEKLGHEVTYISPFHPRGPYINPNITEIVPKKLAATMEAFLANDFDINFRIKKQLPSNVNAFYPTGVKACKDLVESEELDEYLRKTKKLDLLILDNCLTECAMLIAYKYGAKHITFSTITLTGNEHDFFGLTPESGSIPELELFAPKPPMSFMERVKNALTSIHFRYVHYTWYVPQIDELIRTKMAKMGYHDMPFVDDMLRNTSLVLSMGDIVTDYSRSLPPLFVNIGGIHCKKGSKELPTEIQQFLEGDHDGFVYISLGSLVVSSNLPKEMKEVFFQTIESFPRLRFLWKWNGEFPEKVPGNLYLGKWFPQAEILAHPKLKVFVTQSGRPSTIEALCAGVPMIAFPILGDQDATANRMNEMGGNVLLEIGDLSSEQFKMAIEKVAYDKGMKNRILELKNILEDQPMSPLETAVWWTEYVLRHKDTSHLKPAGFNQWWYERRLLDVWAFLFTVILLVLLAAILIGVMTIKILIKIMNGDSNDNEKVKLNKDKLKKKN